MVHIAYSHDDLSAMPSRHHYPGPYGPLSARASLGSYSRREAHELARLEKALDLEEPIGPLPGLANLGNTCFMAAVLQCLLNTPKRFREAVEAFKFAKSSLQQRHLDESSGDGADGVAGLSNSGPLLLGWRLARLLKEYDRTEGEPLGRERGGVLARFQDALSSLDEKYEECEQQDAFEFLGCLLEGLDGGYAVLLRGLGCKVPEGGVVRHLCGVTTFSTRRCLACQACFKVGRATDTTLGLPLVSQAAQMDEAMRLAEEARPVSLVELLRAAQRPEEISDYDCDNCRARAKQAGVPHRRSRMVQRSSLICETKDVLIIALYRFLNTVDADGDFVPVKLRRTVTVPTRLDLETGEYKLYGIVSHCGTDLSSGHYIAAVQSIRDGTWYECDDSRVQPLRLRALYEDSEVTGTRPGADPFILFYHRIGGPRDMVD